MSATVQWCKLQRIKEVKIRLLLEALKETGCGVRVDGRGMMKKG
jgi:hypothetical protein